MQQLLVSQPGGRGNAQLLIAGAGGAPYLVNLSTRQGTPTRFLQVRTANGQQSLINIGSARLNTTTSIRATPSSTTAAQPPPAVSIQQVEQLTPSIIASAKPVTAPPVLAPEISAILQVTYPQNFYHTSCNLIGLSLSHPLSRTLPAGRGYDSCCRQGTNTS